jgi:hypothetical protein
MAYNERVRILPALVLLWSVAACAADVPLAAGWPSALILADESVRFDGVQPRFTSNQLANCSEATRAGLARWAATEQGRRTLSRLPATEYAIVVTEDSSEAAPGRAPQPGIATLAAARDHSKLKVYQVLVNPAAFHPVKDAVAVVPPLTQADMMALAWAAEMLHVDFYARGISLPHHRREDFQREWLAVATELGMPTVRHDDEADERQEWRGRSRTRRSPRGD